MSIGIRERLHRFKVYETFVVLNCILTTLASNFLLVTVFNTEVDLSLPAAIMHSISVVVDLLLSIAIVRYWLGFGDSENENYAYAMKTYLLWFIWGMTTVALYGAIVTGHEMQLASIGLIVYFSSFVLVGYRSILFASEYFDSSFNLGVIFTYSYMTLDAMANLYYLASAERLVLLALACGGILVSLIWQAVLIILVMKQRQSWQWHDFSYLSRVMWFSLLATITGLAVVQLIVGLTSEREVPGYLVLEWQQMLNFIIVQSIVILSMTTLAVIILACMAVRRLVRRHYYLLSTDIEI